jgi:hypothetical protein
MQIGELLLLLLSRVIGQTLAWCSPPLLWQQVELQLQCACLCCMRSRYLSDICCGRGSHVLKVPHSWQHPYTAHVVNTALSMTTLLFLLLP